MSKNAAAVALGKLGGKASPRGKSLKEPNVAAEMAKKRWAGMDEAQRKEATKHLRKDKG